MGRGIHTWQEACHKMAVEKGWWPDTLTEEQLQVELALAQIAIEHLNLSNWLEALRRGENPTGIRPIDSGMVAKFSREKISDLAKMALIHSEVSEATDCVMRDELDQTGVAQNEAKTIYKPEGAVTELADVVIRIMDWCGRKKLHLGAAIHDKFAYNATRPERHGGKLA